VRAETRSHKHSRNDSRYLSPSLNEYTCSNFAKRRSRTHHPFSVRHRTGFARPAKLSFLIIRRKFLRYRESINQYGYLSDLLNFNKFADIKISKYVFIPGRVLLCTNYKGDSPISYVCRDKIPRIRKIFTA